MPIHERPLSEAAPISDKNDTKTSQAKPDSMEIKQRLLNESKQPGDQEATLENAMIQDDQNTERIVKVDHQIALGSGAPEPN